MVGIAKKLKFTHPNVERAFLVGVALKTRRGPWAIDDSLDELAELTRTAGARVVGRAKQRIDRPTQFYVGKGKIAELKKTVKARQIDTVICDDELSPTQQKNLETALGEETKVIDRTALILDVFANRAQTHEGSLQVELAQHEYLMPRLAGQWSHLERLGGGIGTRGPGETQIETDRRLVRHRIQRIKKSLENVRHQRGRSRSRRRDQGIPVASLVGYTNSGKSTLLNRLTGGNVQAQDKLFSTLDPVTRRVRLPSGRDVLFTDTVGFIQKLPPTIVAAFRATLEEIEESTLLIHVIDITHVKAGAQADEVDKVLAELNLVDKACILALNKIDLLPGNLPDAHDAVGKATVLISALGGIGIETLLLTVDRQLDDIETPRLAEFAGPM